MPTGSEEVRFREKTGIHRRTVKNDANDPKGTSTDRMAVGDYAALASRMAIRLRSASKSVGLVSRPSAPPANAFRSVSASPYAAILITRTSGRVAFALSKH